MATIDGTKKKLTVSGEAIESAVNSKHEHSNKTVLDKLSDNNGTLQYDGADITGGGSAYTLPTASETVLGGVKVDGSTITVNDDGIISATATISDETVSEQVAEYLATNGVTVSRYGFTDDLFETGYDNCCSKLLSDSNGKTMSIVFDLGAIVTSPTVTIEFAFEENDAITITSATKYDLSNNALIVSNGVNLNEVTSAMRSTPNKLHTFTTTYNGTGRYAKILFTCTTISAATFKLKTIKMYYNGNVCKYTSLGTNTDYKPFNDDRMLNYGAYNTIETDNKQYNNKIIYCIGDSTTYGENGASSGRGIPYHIGRNFKDCTVINNGNNGATSESFFSRVSEKTDWNNVIAVTACYGWNDGGASGSIAGSIPQLTCQDLNTVITEGITVSDTLIDTEEKYFALFSNDWYGRMAKAIEYIKFYNPMTQIFLHSPHSSDQWSNHQTMCSNITEAMKELAEYYAIPFIDCHGLLGITDRNSHNYRLDWAHLGDLGNDIKGNMIANSMKPYMLYPLQDDELYNKQNVTGITMNRDTETVEVGSAIYLYCKVSPYNARNKSVRWSTDNNNVIVEEVAKGLEWQKIKVTGVTDGATIITATSDEDSTKIATCTVNCGTVNEVSVTGVTIDETATVDVGSTVSLRYTVSPTNATNKAVTFSVNNGNCTVSTTGVVTGVTEGTSVVTVTTKDGSFTDTCTVTINAKAPSGSTDELPTPTTYSLENGNFVVGRIDNSTGKINTGNTTYMQNETPISATPGDYYFVEYDTKPGYLYAHFWNDSAYISSINLNEKALGFEVPSGCTKVYIIATNGTSVINVYKVNDYILGEQVVGDSTVATLVKADAYSGGQLGFATGYTKISNKDLVVEAGASYTLSDLVFSEGNYTNGTIVREYKEGTRTSYQNATVSNNVFTVGSDTHHIRIRVGYGSSSNPTSITITKNS